MNHELTDEDLRKLKPFLDEPIVKESEIEKGTFREFLLRHNWASAIVFAGIWIVGGLIIALIFGAINWLFTGKPIF